MVGHLDFADVTEIHVAKDDVPITNMSLVERAAVCCDKEKDLDVEYWSNLYPEIEANQKYARIIRWSLMQEERLKISTNSGTLYFRFYSDLACCEAERSEAISENPHAIKRDIAFQWAETIARICGRRQLHQNLPHFGEGNEAELQDYLEVVHFHEKEAGNVKRSQNIRGFQNLGNVDLSFPGTNERTSSWKKMKHQRTRSMLDFRSIEIDGSTRNKSSEEDGVPSSAPRHRPVKSMSAFAKNFSSTTGKNDFDSHV